MSESLKISGKKIELPQAEKKFKFEKRPGGWIIATDSSGNRIRFSTLEMKGNFSALIFDRTGGHAWFGGVSQRSRDQAGQASAADFTAQFPGKVRKICVSGGAKVQAGDPLILVEAMKMEFAVKAPEAGSVTKILVKEGQQLSPGDLMLEFTAEKNG